MNSTLVRVTIYALLMAAYSGIAVIKETSSLKGVGDFPSSVHANLSIIVSILVV
jgi:hypothetical protein